MLSQKDVESLNNFIENATKPWVWIDISITSGPTAVETFFKELFGDGIVHHWSPAVAEGYLEIRKCKNIVIHWVVGDSTKILNMQELNTVDFDKIDDALYSTLIHNSVIRLLSDRF